MHRERQDLEAASGSSRMDPGRDYYVCCACPHCFRCKWVLKRNLEMSLEELLNTFWEFECPVHGPLRERPLQASPKKTFKKDTKN